MIVVNRVSFGYGPRLIFDELSVEFDREIEVIFGPSGCGKSTLLKLLTGVFRADAGEIWFDSNNRLLVLQEDALFPWLTGLQNIAVMYPNRKNIGALVRNHSAFDLVSEFIDQKAWKMSFGQRRSVELLRALISDAHLICLDEPFNFLDKDRRIRFAQVIIELARSTQVIISTHDLHDLPEVFRHPFCFDGGLPINHLDRRYLP